MIDKTVSRVISESLIYSTHTMLGVRHVGHLRTKWGGRGGGGGGYSLITTFLSRAGTNANL